MYGISALQDTFFLCKNEQRGGQNAEMPIELAQCYLTRYIGQHLENFYFKFVGKFLIER